MNVLSNQLDRIDLHNNNLGAKSSEVTIKAIQIKKAETSSAEAISSMPVSYLCLYGNDLYIFKESKNRNGTNVSVSTYVGHGIPIGSKISGHSIAYEGHLGPGPSYSGGITGIKTVLSGSNYQGSWSDPDLGSSWCSVKYYYYKETTDDELAGSKYTFFTQQGEGSWANGSRLWVYPYGE